MLSHYLYTLSLLATFLAIAHAAPTSHNSILKRQDGPFTGPNKVTTHNVIAVAGGSVVEDCTITLTAVVVDGKNLVEEKRSCTDTFVPTGQTAPPSSSSQSSGTASTTTAASDSTTTTTTTTESVSTTDSSASTTATDSASPVDTTSTSTSASDTIAPAPAPTDSGSASVSDSASASSTVVASISTDTAAAPASTATSAGGAASTDGSGAVVIGSGSIPATDAPPPSTTTSPQAQNAGTTTGSAANDSAPSSSQVAIPGKKLEVLPIGLGVFAGISVIALIVVGLVTYERTKYRKAFRQRRLAASGAEMGYGGMSERR